MAVVVKGLEPLVRDLRGMPKKSQKALRDALNIVLDESIKEIINITNRELGIKKSIARRQLTVKRPKIISGQLTLFAKIEASKRRIPLREYKPRIITRSPTRAAVSVKDQIGKPTRISGSAFVNPRHNRKDVMRRITRSGKRVGRLPVNVAAGPSMAVHLGAIVTPSFQRKKGARLAQIFNEELNNRL